MQILAFDTHERIRETAFALLLRERRAITPDELVEASGIRDIGPILEALGAAGWIDRERGNVTGSAGLSLTEGPHRLRLGTTTFRTWCGYDALGIPAALGVDAEVETACGLCAAPIVLSMVGGRPGRTGPERLWLADRGDDLRTSFCTPTVLLCGPQHGSTWAEQQGQAGILLDLAEAAAQGGEAWAGCAVAASRLGESVKTDVEYVGGPRDEEHEHRTDTPPTVPGLDGTYRRSVRCADDGALRYVWYPDGEAAPISS